MDEGITGFNASLAINNIRQFASEVEAAYKSLQSAIGDFTFGLSNNWASPKAVEFKVNVKPLFDELFQDMNDKSLAIQRGAIEAYNIAARSHGSTTIEDFSEGFFDSTDFSDLYEIKDGKVGMNIEEVKNELLPNFSSKMKSAADQISSVPTAIALYDDEGGQQRAYSTGISRFKEKVISILDVTEKYIQQALDTEANAVFQSAQSATSTLNVTPRA